MGLYAFQLWATIYIRQGVCQLGEEADTQFPRIALAAEGRREGHIDYVPGIEAQMPPPSPERK